MGCRLQHVLAVGSSIKLTLDESVAFEKYGRLSYFGEVLAAGVAMLDVCRVDCFMFGYVYRCPSASNVVYGEGSFRQYNSSQRKRGGGKNYRYVTFENQSSPWK